MFNVVTLGMTSVPICESVWCLAFIFLCLVRFGRLHDWLTFHVISHSTLQLVHLIVLVFLYIYPQQCVCPFGVLVSAFLFSNKKISHFCRANLWRNPLNLYSRHWRGRYARQVWSHDQSILSFIPSLPSCILTLVNLQPNADEWNQATIMSEFDFQHRPYLFTRTACLGKLTRVRPIKQLKDGNP